MAYCAILAAETEDDSTDHVHFGMDASKNHCVADKQRNITELSELE